MLYKFIKCWVLVATLAIGGCSTIISHYISSQQSYGVEELASDQQLVQQGFIKSEFCSQQSVCISYLQAQSLSDKSRLSYDVAIDVGDQIENVGLKLNRDDSLTAMQGTVVLVHGFRASKEFMVNSALYFRFLGFDVLMPDLLGHGESQGEISFGLKDSVLINQLLDSQVNLKYPLLLVGNSMGAVATSYLANQRNDITGLILQAPMIVFDDAAVNYLSNYSRYLSMLVSQNAIRSGAVKALNSANVSLKQTDIIPIISALNIPVLITASSSDPVAPYDYFKPLSNDNITVIEVENRSHPGMAVIAQRDHGYLQIWLTSNASGH